MRSEDLVKIKKNLNENIDTLGTEWKYAHHGQNFLNKYQNHIWDLHIELAGYAALFRNLNNCDFSPNELYGISLTLMKASRRLGRIHESLERKIQEKSFPNKSK